MPESSLAFFDASIQAFAAPNANWPRGRSHRHVFKAEATRAYGFWGEPSYAAQGVVQGHSFVRQR